MACNALRPAVSSNNATTKRQPPTAVSITAHHCNHRHPHNPHTSLSPYTLPIERNQKVINSSSHPKEVTWNRQHRPAVMRAVHCILLLIAVAHATAPAAAGRLQAGHLLKQRRAAERAAVTQNPDGEENWNTAPIIGILTQVCCVCLASTTSSRHSLATIAGDAVGDTHPGGA